MMDLKNKRVLVVGLGKSGLSAAMFLREQGARVTVSDTRSAVALEKEIPALLEAGIMVESGGHGLLTFRRQDLIVVSPGVPMDTPEVKQVVAFGLPVIGELELASRHLQGRVVAITGSNGKTTTTTLVGKIFADAGVPTLVGGDFNVIPEDIDCHKPSSWEHDALFQPEPRARYRAMLSMGYTDAFRSLHVGEIGHFTFWDYFRQAFQNNRGIRIDHFLLSPTLADRLESCEIDKGPRGQEKPSDHTPIMVTLSDLP